jgi:hypothetical protein
MNSFDGDVDIDLTKPSYSVDSAFVVADDYLPPTRQSSSTGGADAPAIRQMSEEEMLEAAIKASLEDAQPDDHDAHAQEPIDSSDEEIDDDVDLSRSNTLADDFENTKKRKATNESIDAAPAPKKPKLDASASSSNFKSSFPAPSTEDSSLGPRDCTIQLRLPNGTTLTVRITPHRVDLTFGR